MSAALLPLSLAFLMFVVGLRLTFSGMADVFRRPAALMAGLGVQMLLLPLTAVAIARVLSLDAAMTTGLLVIAAAPGGITSNYVAMAARADIALSTAMTLVTSLAASVSIPAALTLAGEGVAAGGLSGLVRISMAMFAVTALPLMLGIAFRRFLPGIAAASAVALDRLSALVFAAIVLATFWQNREAMLAYAAAIGPAAALLNLGAIAAGFGVAKAVGLPRPQGYAIAIETGLQNVAMAMFVASAVLDRGELKAPALVYAVLMNISALAIIVVGRRRQAAAA